MIRARRRAQLREKLRLRRFQRIEAELAERGFLRAGGKNPHFAEAANVGVAKFAAVVEREKYVSMRHDGRLERADDDLPGHAQMNEERET